MRFWVAKDSKKGMLFITMSKFARIEGNVRETINTTIAKEWPECESWPRKFIKRVDTALDVVSGEVQLTDPHLEDWKTPLATLKVAN